MHARRLADGDVASAKDGVRNGKGRDGKGNMPWSDVDTWPAEVN